MAKSYTEKAELFLERQLDEGQNSIKKLKRKRNMVRLLFASLIVLSVTSSTVCATFVGINIPPLFIPILSMTAGLTTALSVKFNLEGKKLELDKTIEQLDKIEQKIDYVVSCNGNFAEAEYKQVIGELIPQQHFLEAN